MGVLGGCQGAALVCVLGRAGGGGRRRARARASSGRCGRVGAARRPPQPPPPPMKGLTGGRDGDRGDQRQGHEDARHLRSSRVVRGFRGAFRGEGEGKRGRAGRGESRRARQLCDVFWWARLRGFSGRARAGADRRGPRNRGIGAQGPCPGGLRRAEGGKNERPAGAKRTDLRVGGGSYHARALCLSFSLSRSCANGVCSQ